MYDLFIYYFVFALDFILCFFAFQSKNKFLLFLSFLLPIIFVGFRYNVGTDYQNYVDIFEKFKTFDFNTFINYEWEFATKLIILLVTKISTKSSIMFLLIAILNYYPIFRINKYYNYKYLPLSILMYNCIFLPFCMNGMRQGIAMSIILLSVFLIIQNRRKEAVVYFILSYLFHSSSILFLPYFIILLFNKKNKKKDNISRKVILLTIIIAIVILFFLKDLLLSFGVLKYSSYYNEININNVSFNAMLTYMPIIFIIIFSKYKDSVIDTLKPLILSGFIFHIVGTTAKYLYRISLFFTIFEIFLIPYLISNIKDRKTKIVVYIFLILYLLVYFWYQFYFVGQHEIFPYNFRF